MTEWSLAHEAMKVARMDSDDVVEDDEGKGAVEDSMFRYTKNRESRCQGRLLLLLSDAPFTREGVCGRNPGMI